MVNSINTNIAAYSAQGNIGRASDSAASSIARLSSGNRIVKASDDVAALSIGTSLRTGVTTLRQALANTAQGSSLLQVADGSLSQISEILQRQKAIATQANSGTLSDTERGYLNQEFQALKSQIDQIATSSSFSSVKLLDGSLSGSVDVTTSTTKSALAITDASQLIFTVTDEVTAADTLIVNGKTFTATTPITDAQSQFDIGTDAATQAAFILTALNGSTDPSLSKFLFTSVVNGANTEIRASLRPDQVFETRAEATLTFAEGVQGTAGDITVPATSPLAFYLGDTGTVFTLANAVPANGDKITVGGVTVEFTNQTQGTAAAVGKVQIGSSIANSAANIAAFLNSSTDARLANFYFESSGAVVSARLATGALGGATGLAITGAVVTGTGANYGAATATVADTNSKDGLGEGRTRAIGELAGSLLANSGTGAQNFGTGINLVALRNAPEFVGKLGGESLGEFEAVYVSADTVSFQLKVGDVTYRSAATDVTNTNATSITLTGTDANGNKLGGSFDITIRGAAVSDNTINSQADANNLVTRLNDSFANVTFVQNRDVASFSTAQTVTVGGVEVARLDNVTVDLRSDTFGGGKIQSFTITAPRNGQTDAIFEAVIDGETFRSISNIGSTFDNNKAIQLQSLTNPNNVLTIVTSNNDVAASTSISLDASTQANANAIATAFQEAFGLGDAGEALNFQVGASSTDTIGVTIDSVGSASLYGGETLDVTSLQGAQAASVALESAINTINQVRASVGALQSRLDFTSANLQASIQNQDAARGTLLDTDVAAESTDYATAQVQLQAGIAVLAQANQLPQNLLKLIS